MISAAAQKQTLWITRTGVFIALLVVWQMTTAPLKNTLLTGSVVNLLLIFSVMFCGRSSGVTVAMLSPIFAKLLGIGPLWSLIPFIAIGNIVFVLLWNITGNAKTKNRTLSHLTAAVLAASAKFGVLYLLVVRLAVPVILRLPPPQAAAISGVFSLPQLVTASIGGALAVLMLPLLGKALKRDLY